MAAVEQRHPKMARGVVLIVFGLRVQHAAARPHALEIDDRLGEDREMWWRRTVRPGFEVLAERHLELVVHPTVRRKPLPGIAVLGRDICRSLDLREVLQAPGIGFADRHGSGTDGSHGIAHDYSGSPGVRPLRLAFPARPGPRRLFCRGRAADRPLGARSLAGGGGAL